LVSYAETEILKMLLNYNAPKEETEYKKLKVKIRNLTFEQYKTFKENLLEFWENYQVKTEDEKYNIAAIEVKFFGEGLTEAYVFRAEVKFKDEKEPHFVRVLKYDKKENIHKEANNYISVVRKAEKVFPVIEKGEIREFSNGKAILPMSSIIDSMSAEVLSCLAFQY